MSAPLTKFKTRKVDHMLKMQQNKIEAADITFFGITNK